MNTRDIVEELKKKCGSKATRTQKAILTIFEKNHLPLTESELQAKLSKSDIVVNKTTVYRQLAHLKEHDFIKEIDFGDGKKRFELNSNDRHHHHLVCTNCKMVDDIKIDNDVISIERAISKARNFKIMHHSLEFFGLCKNCK